MSIANTSPTTTLKNVRLKLNEVIGVVNSLQSNGFVANTSQLVNGAYTVDLQANGNLRFHNGSLISIDEGGPGSGTIDIAPGANTGWSELRSFNYNNYVWVDDGGVYVGTNWNRNPKQWTYASNGALVFPDGTPQNTAFRLQLLNPYLQVANAAAKYATKAYAASNAYVKLLLANTNAYIADVAASSGGGGYSAEAFDYGTITSSADVELNRDYGTL